MQMAIHGALYLVSDKAISMPPEDTRNLHQERRYFLVLSGSDSNSDPTWPIVFGCPLSSARDFNTIYDVKLAAGEGNVVKKCWVRVTLAQPLAKADLQDRAGTLTASRLEEVQAKLLWYMGMISHNGDISDPS